MKFKKSNIIVFIILLAGISLISYPSVANWWNSMHQSRAVAGYVEKTENMNDKEIEEMLNIAEIYNSVLETKNMFRYCLTESEITEYNRILDVTGTGIMAYVEIPKVKVKLPVYHGTDEGVLQIAAGHIPGTSFPIGGEGTHAVISGHSALPSARLFTDIDKLEIGDIFNINVLNRIMTYQVDNISIVLPDELENLNIESGKDYVTLLTCTPYGINSHRLLVRGVRADSAGENFQIMSDAVKANSIVVSIIMALAAAVLYIMYKLVIMLFMKIISKRAGN